MTDRAGIASIVAAVVVLTASPAVALKITIVPARAVPVNQPQTFALATVTDAVGAMVTHWDFGDGASVDVTGKQVTHTYASVGHYTVIVKASDDVASAYGTVVQTVHYPLPTVAPRVGSSIILDEANREVWNTNRDSDSVSVLDSATGVRKSEIKVGKEPHALAQVPDGSVWVACSMSDEITIVDRATRVVRERIALPYASQPRSVVFSPDGKSAYVSLFATGKLAAIDVNSRKVRATVDLGPTPHGVSVASDGRIFVTRFLSPNDHGEVWVVAPDPLKLESTIVLPFDNSTDSSVNGRGVPNYVASFNISPDGTQAWVVAEKPNIARGPQRDGLHMNSDSFVRSIICVVDMTTGMEVVSKRLDLDNRNMPVAVAFSPVGDYGYVALETNNEISFQDGYTLTNLGAIKQVGNSPDGVVLGSDGKLWVNAFISREVIAYDMTASIASIDQTAPDPLWKTRAIEVEPLPEQVLQGKKVFYNAADPRMDRVGYMACASCHLGGFNDGRTWDFTDRGEGLRNTKSLLGIRGTGQGRLHWSANMDEIQDFDRDIRDSFEGFGFMPHADYDARKDPSGEYDPFGKVAAGTSPELDAIAAYVTSLDKVPRSPYRNPDGSFTAAALKGREIFKSVGCAVCHSGPDFTDSPLGILHDVGTLLPTSGNRLGKPLLGIDTPTLKGVWATAPYYHDGRAATLREVLTTYNAGDKMARTSKLTTTELDQLVEYLMELDDEPEPATAVTPAAQAGCGCRLGGGDTHDRRGLLGGLALLLLAWARVRSQHPVDRR